MAVYNYAGGEANIKIVYYGPGLSGKTTNLEHMYSKLPRENKGKMVSMKTRTDRTLFFDFLPIEFGELGGLNVRFLLYTVPGQVYYNATRKLVLKGVDAVVFVADSSSDRMADNLESLQNLEENLNEIGKSLSDIPWVMQYNKRDLAHCLPVERLQSELNTRKAPYYEAVATEGSGVYETFEAIAGLVFKQLKKELNDREIDRTADGGGKEKESINVEVVAQGKKSADCSETGESETSGYAEEREEEHESVSEFLDNVLQERGSAGENLEDLSSDRDGNEEYGHMVELGGGETGTAPEATAVKVQDGAARDGVAKVETDDVSKEKVDFINDPLDKLEDSDTEEPSPFTEDAREEKVESPDENEPLEKTVTVPVSLTEEEAREGCRVSIVVELQVERQE